MIDQIERTHRALGTRTTPAGETRTVLLRRTYDAVIEDVWDACTNAERISRWLVPVTGNLVLGGTYQLEGNAGGEIVRCEPPSLLKVTWVYGDDPATNTSEVEVRLSSADDGQTVFELEHLAVDVDPDFWQQFGPGACGIGWDLALLGLTAHLAGETLDDARKAELMDSPEAREFMTTSGIAWRAAHEAAGADPQQARAAADRTIAFFTEMPESTDAG